jgi:hypothetical protein
MGYKIVKIYIPECDELFTVGKKGVYEICESYKQVSNDCIKNIYVVKIKNEIGTGIIEISADMKGIMCYKEYHSYIRKRKIKQHRRLN